ncbi:hypothetical protein M513_10735 [Trichuris suis]|uniref:Uncharacterized protein n=1 Tax=Trichuris suis TaxID=68888 RepID=A0A085LTT7_9BILA|nr:hypothetical protein M513_10735 [Trichuris suis]
MKSNARLCVGGLAVTNFVGEIQMRKKLRKEKNAPTSRLTLSHGDREGMEDHAFALSTGLPNC